MEDWLSYFLVVLAGVALLFFRSIIGAVGKDLYTWLKRKISPPEPPPIKVKSTFRPAEDPEGHFVWIGEHDVPNKLAKGYKHYLGPEDGARRYQIPNEPQGLQDKAFFMRQPRD